MKIHILTHGDKEAGVDPCLTQTGVRQIESVTLPSTVFQIISGTGNRFQQSAEIVRRRLGHEKDTRFSPLCGSADSGEKAESGFQVILANGRVVPLGDYIGLIGTPGVNVNAFLNALPENTLLIAGRELLGALGYKDALSGVVYGYDGETVYAGILT
ncbi:MAG: hypothetical protein KBD47_00370 [Candidatus Pacebacteria bacterium]|nr:hypothetical protein [Candidatus Paceibacterota bacterium]